jgi:hypothetical protein
MVEEADWFGHWLMLEGLKPGKKKVDTVLRLQPPTDIKQVQSFVGSVNHYRDMFPHQSYQLAPLSYLTSNASFQWTSTQQHAFDAMKAMMIWNCHNQHFVIYTNASDYQLSAVIMQNNAPVAYYSCKLNDLQKNYTTMEKGLLSIYETFNKFCSMLLSAQIDIFTDHKNLTYASTVNQ